MSDREGHAHSSQSEASELVGKWAIYFLKQLDYMLTKGTGKGNSSKR